jgi:hypothetical protein
MMQQKTIWKLKVLTFHVLKPMKDYFSFKMSCDAIRGEYLNVSAAMCSEACNNLETGPGLGKGLGSLQQHWLQ